MVNTPRIKINKVNSLLNTGNNSNKISINNNDSIKSNHYRKIIKMNSCKINYERNNNSNILSAKHLTNTNTNNINNEIKIDEYQNKIIQEKISELSVEQHKNIPYKKLFSNKLYSKKLSKLNNSLYKSYISNQNKGLNDSYQMNSFIKQNNGNNDSLSLISFESNTIESLNKYSSKFITTNEKNNIIPCDILNTNEIKLEQIIALLSLEDLLILEDKLYIVLQIFKNGKKSSDELFDLWNYFFSSSLMPKFEQIFKYFLKETEAMKIFINYSLILIIISYDFSFNSNKNNHNIYFSLFEALRLVYINFLFVIFLLRIKLRLKIKIIII